MTVLSSTIIIKIEYKYNYINLNTLIFALLLGLFPDTSLYVGLNACLVRIDH